MTVQITGKNIDAGEAFQAYVSEKLTAILDKYIGTELSAHVRVEKERGRFRTHCSTRLRTGLLLESHGEGQDAYSSADTAFERLEKRVRRYKRRLKNHHHGSAIMNGQEGAAGDYVVNVDADNEAEDKAGPVIVAETVRTLRTLPVSEAVMRLDLTEEAFLVFRNAAHGGINIVYQRSDGHIGWIDPKAEEDQGSMDPGAVAAELPDGV